MTSRSSGAGPAFWARMRKAVSRWRPKSLLKAETNLISFIPRPTASAWLSPFSVSGLSIQPCTWSVVFKNVFPWRTR